MSELIFKLSNESKINKIIKKTELKNNLCTYIYFSLNLQKILKYLFILVKKYFICV